MSSQKYKGFAVVGTVAAVIAWIVMIYGIFMVQSNQFQMLISGKDAINAQKLAEVDGSLVRLVDYDELNNSSALNALNLHTNRDTLQTVTFAEGENIWQDEIKIGEEQNNGTDSPYGNFRIATVNIYKNGDTIPRFSLTTPILRYAQPYTREEIDKFIEERKAKDRELEAKDRELEATDRELMEVDEQLREADRQISQAGTALVNRIALSDVEFQTSCDIHCNCPPPTPPSGGSGGGSTPPSGGGGSEISHGSPPNPMGPGSDWYNSHMGGGTP